MKKVLATLLALVLVLGMIPMAGLVAFAEGDELQLQNPDLPNSRSNPYLIGTVDDWVTFCNTAAALTENAFFALSADIDFKDHNTEGYMTDGDKNMDCVYADKFWGSFDGNGYALRNLEIKTKTAANFALFQSAQGASFRNITFDNVDIIVDSTPDNSNYNGMLVGTYYASKGDGTGALLEGFERDVFENLVFTDTCSITIDTPYTAPRTGFVIASASRASGGSSWAATFRNIYVGGTITTNGSRKGGSEYYGAIIGDNSSYQSNTANTSVKMRFENIATNLTVNLTHYEKTGNYAIGGLAGEIAINALEVRNCYLNTTVNMDWGTDLTYTKGGTETTVTANKEAQLTTGGVGGVIGTLGRPDNFRSVYDVTDYVIEDCVVNMTLGGSLYADTASDAIPYTGALVGLLGRKGNTGYLISNVKVEDVTYAINSMKFTKYGNTLPAENDTTITFDELAAPPTTVKGVQETAGTVKLAQAQIAKNQIALGAVKIAPMVSVKDVAAIKLAADTSIKFWVDGAAAATEFFKTAYNLTVSETGIAILKKADYDAANRDVAAVDASKVKLVKADAAVTDTIAAADYGTEYVAVGYAKLTYNGTQYTTYLRGATSAKSVAGIAALALADPCVSYTDAQKALLTGFAPAAN